MLWSGDAINRQCRGCGYNPTCESLNLADPGVYGRGIKGEDITVTIDRDRCPYCGGRFQTLSYVPTSTWEEYLHRRSHAA